MGIAVVAESEEIRGRAPRSLKIEWEENPFILEMGKSLIWAFAAGIKKKYND
jgi:hypothetical protein